jgi:hypothetical protein
MKKCGGGTKQWGSGMTSTHRSLLGSRRSFRWVDFTISFAIEHLAILSKLIHCIAICIANGVATRNSGAAVPTSSTTTSLQVTSWSSGTFPMISLLVPSFSFILMFFNRCRFSIHPTLVTHSGTSSMTRSEVVAPTPTTQTATMTVLDFFLCVVNFVMLIVCCTLWCLVPSNFVMHCYNCWIMI